MTKRLLTAISVAAALAVSPAEIRADDPPISAFGIVAHSPVADLPVGEREPNIGLYPLKSVPVPLDGPFRYGVVASPEGGVCDLVASTRALPAKQAGALKGRLYVHFSSRLGRPWKQRMSPPFHVWEVEYGTGGWVILALHREAGERESVVVQHSFFGLDGALCYPGQMGEQ